MYQIIIKNLPTRIFQTFYAHNILVIILCIKGSAEGDRFERKTGCYIETYERRKISETNK